MDFLSTLERWRFVMIRKVVMVSSLVLLSFFASCSKDDDSKSTSDSSYKLNELTYKVISSTSLTHATDSLSGVGSVVFTEPNKDADNHYTLNFTLEDGGSLTLTSNSANDLNAGVSITFSRLGQVLVVGLRSSDQVRDISSSFSDIDASGSLSFQIDMHNGENPTHILVWSGVSEFGEDNALFNSEEDGETPGQGTDNFWGLVLSNANVSSALVSEAKFEE